MAAPTTGELAVLQQFRDEVHDVLPNLNEYRQTDAWLLRWLRARELDIGKASRMLRRSLEWRDQEKINDILSWEPPNILMEEFGMKLSGFDNDGSPVGIVPFGDWDIRKVIEMRRKDIFVKYIDFLFEIALHLVERRSTKEKVLTQFVLIMDLDRFSFRQIASRETIDAIFEAIKRFEANHPETLKAAYLINAPRIFAYLFSFIKPLLTARTLDKVQIFGSNGSFKPVLLKTIAPDQLPSEMGGCNTSCTNYTVKDLNELLDNPIQCDDFSEADMSAITVDSGKKVALNVQVPTPKSRMSWNFKTEKHDIGFAVVSPCNEALVHVSRADANTCVQKGAIICESAGTYQIIFDNSFSRFRSKHVRYAVSVNKPLDLDLIK
ncbi:unnamed protein product [Allacma fusca]|uniref:Uncharacterized protein n=1 Tax=Allacma fusca TaxID=39272 RepID=A0A8J2LCM6_9HEXA|nr:unnamed protein product [Allacma fusca]